MSLISSVTQRYACCTCSTIIFPLLTNDILVFGALSMPSPSYFLKLPIVYKYISILSSQDNNFQSILNSAWAGLRRLETVSPSFKQINILGSLSTRVFETRTATGREYFASQDSGVSQIFILIITNGEKILSNVNVVV